MNDTKIFKAGITVDGKFVYGKDYDILTQVYYDPEDGGDGCSYVSRTANKNVVPGTNPLIWVKASDRGKKGDIGKSAYQDAVDKGFEGTVEEWLESLVGPQGNPGVGFSSVDTNRQGTVVIRLTNGDTITMELAHEHPQYLEYTITGTV